MALAPSKIKKIEKLLKIGELSKRAISRQEGVSRITIDRIEKRLLFPGEEPPPLSKPEYIRCKGCGGKQLKNAPCLVCKLQHNQISDYNSFMDSLLSPSPLSSKSKVLSNEKAKTGRS